MGTPLWKTIINQGGGHGALASWGKWPHQASGSTREGSPGLSQDQQLAGCCPADDGFIVTAVSLSRKKTDALLCQS